jgi:hypothetical protein
MDGWNRAGASEVAAVSVVASCFCLSNQSRAGKERDPIEFSFHDFDFLSVVLESFC